MTISEAPAAPRFSGPRSARTLLADAFEGMERALASNTPMLASIDRLS